MHQHSVASLIRKTLFFLVATLLAGIALSTIPPLTARADEFNVGCNVADLIQAITDANGNGQPDTINLTLGCSYTLTTTNNTNDGPNGLPSITSVIAINGNGATIERSSEGGTPQFRIFHVASGGDLTLTDITIANGDAGSNRGGGVYSKGTLNISHSTLSDNAATFGGGIYNENTVDISHSTLSGNTADYGGGILNNGGPTWTHALQDGSPAIDQIANGTDDCGTTYTTDQRGYDRPCPTEGGCDIGAYEYALFGDLNCDCDVNIGDVMLVANCWRCRSGDDCYDERYDLDRDGDIDIVDIMLVAAHWRDAC